MNSEDFISRLKQFGDLEWYRHAGGIGVDGTPIPPVIVWRFPAPQPTQLAELIRISVISNEREIDWLFDTTRRNWVLTPSRVISEKELHNLATEAQAVDLLSKTDPEFCEKSVRDFDRIIAALDRHTDIGP
ncbi:hypothetical protein ACFWUP_19020 [Nocardia sp. NPDC058658]|uniref:hypothetical protein n=1 Tax=Nocardia sp. NPDC058658 TaxID=3346580 RepID=UPI00366967EC